METAEPAAGPVDVTGALPAGARTRTLDEGEFQTTYRTLARPLWCYLYRVLGSGTEADDALQETFLRYVQAPLPTSDEKQIRAFLYRIASNLAIDMLRRRTRERLRFSDEPVDERSAIETSTGDALALRHDMARTFRKLSPQHRMLLWLAYVEGSGHAEMAQTLGLKKSSVPVLLFRARRKLARLLSGRGWEG